MKNEIIIMGGGPGGAALGCYLSMAGISNTIIESKVFPRDHVGESMVTATTRIFEDIGFLETMEKQGFVRKYGASWHPTAARAALHVEFCEIVQEGINQDYTYHVDRSHFDQLLLKHAEKLGSTVLQGVRVRKVLFKKDTAVGVKVRVAQSDLDIPAKIVVDATGRQTLLGNQLRLRCTDPDFNQFAVHAWFDNVDRGDRGDNIHFLPINRGWIWQIPISEKITSIGVVAEKDLFKEGKGDYESWFERLSNSAPDVARAMNRARRINELKVEADYSYHMQSFVGNGWMLVGDAARFVDPIFSSGVSVAMHSGKFASEQIAQALAADDVSKPALIPYEKRLKMGTAIWYEFIRLYYKLLPIFTVFISKPEYRLQVIQLLQGDVYDRQDAPVLQAMRDFIGAVEQSEDHLLRPYLDGSLGAAADFPAPHELV